jgi:hypothetical protein
VWVSAKEDRRALPVLLAVYVLGMAAALSGHTWVWDDRALVVAGRLAPLGEALGLAWTADFWALADGSSAHSSGMYRPLTGTLYALERAVFGVAPGGAHGVNVVLHAGVAGLVGLLARQLGGRAWLAAAVVLLHPHAGELVGNVAARTDLLAALGVMGALVLRERRPGWAAVALLMGCLSKEVAFAGLGLWWALDAWQGRRPRVVPGLVAVGVAAGLRLAVLGVGLDSEGGEMDPLGALASSGLALSQLVVPWPGGPWPVAGSAGLGLGVAAVALVGSGLGWARGVRWPVLLVGWVGLAWAPMAGWLPVEVRPSRALLYLALPGVALVLSLVRDGVVVRGGLALLLAGSLVGHGWVASRWADPLTLWSWGVETNPTEPLCHLNLGRARAEHGDRDGARVAYESAAGLAMQQEDATWFVPAATALGRLAVDAGEPRRARMYWEDAVSIGGDAAGEAAAGLAELP